MSEESERQKEAIKMINLSPRDRGIEAGDEKLREAGQIKLIPEEYEVISANPCFGGKSPSVKGSRWEDPKTGIIRRIRDITARGKGGSYFYLPYPECYDFQGPNDYYRFAENCLGIPYIRLMKASEALVYAERIKQRYINNPKTKNGPVEDQLWVQFRGKSSEVGIDERARKLWEEMVGSE